MNFLENIIHKNKKLDQLDKKITLWMKKYGLLHLRISLGIIFIWFGILKPFGLSPAQELVANTVYWFSPTWFVPFLGWWEVMIGICLLYKPLIRLGILLMGVQMAGTFLPLILLPNIVYGNTPFVLTLEGQYIVKNIILISAAIVIGSHVRD
jgi:uncharacterized membrane protein YkgB